MSEETQQPAPSEPTIESRLAALEEAIKSSLESHASIVAKLKQHGIEVTE
jgi:hypothetical protein